MHALDISIKGQQIDDSADAHHMHAVVNWNMNIYGMYIINIYIYTISNIYNFSDKLIFLLYSVKLNQRLKNDHINYNIYRDPGDLNLTIIIINDRIFCHGLIYS